MKDSKKIGLALSGGGYRAAAFHLGTLRKLYELNILDKVDVFSTISGGSITGAAYCTRQWNYPDFEAYMITTLKNKSVVRFILTSFVFWRAALLVLVFLVASAWVLFTQYAWLSPVLLIAMAILLTLFQYKIFPVSKVIEKAYDRFFFEKKSLSALINYPAIAIGSTNIQTSRPFTFSKQKMGDSTYAEFDPPILFKHAAFPLSRAVMASSCVPFAFTPVLIGKKYFVIEADADRITPVLVDGGVYDNQGIHKLTEPKSSFGCDTIITSDAGNKPTFKKSFNNVLVLLIRTMDVFMARIKDFQIVTNVYRNISSGINREITYVSLGWDLEKLIPGFVDNFAAKNIAPSVINAHKIPPGWLTDGQDHSRELTQLLKASVNYAEIEKNAVGDDDKFIARHVGTNLTKLSAKEVDCLSRHAANITELQIKLYCPSLI